MFILPNIYFTEFYSNNSFLFRGRWWYYCDILRWEIWPSQCSSLQASSYFPHYERFFLQFKPNWKLFFGHGEIDRIFYPFQLWNICTNTYTIYSCYWQRKNSKTQMFPVNGEIIYLQILAYFHSSQRTSSMTQDRVCKIIGLNFLKIDEKVRLIYNHCSYLIFVNFSTPPHYWGL